MNELTFKVGDNEYKVRQPSLQENNEAKKVYNVAFNEALAAKSPLQIKMADILKEQGLWSDDKQAQYDKLNKDILEREFTLHKGGIYKSKAREIAIKIKNLREELNALFTPMSNFRIRTCEGQAENAKFDYLVSVCVVYTDGRPYFSSYEDYLNRSNDAVAIVGAGKFADLHYRLNDDFQSDLIENKFLKEHGFVDDKYRLIDSKGRLISEDGRLINEDGNLVDENGNLVDVLGHKIDKDGQFMGESAPFLDDSADSEKDSATT